MSDPEEPFVVRQFEGSAWVPLREAARLHAAVEECGVTIAGLRNALTMAVPNVERALREAGFAPDFNVCGRCGHHGGDHDLDNWCLICPRPEMPARPALARLAAGWCYFSSMDEAEKWAAGVKRFLAAAK